MQENRQFQIAIFLHFIAAMYSCVGARGKHRSGRETISTVRQAGCAWLAVLIAATFEICKASASERKAQKLGGKRALLSAVAAGRTACTVAFPVRRSSICPGRAKIHTFYAMVFVELRSPTRRDISRDATKAQTAFASSHLISTAKFGLLRSGYKKNDQAEIRLIALQKYLHERRRTSVCQG
ncbi:hypothetical protein [Lacticaseibacillus jixiensis]|uniref:hypothetical protein n=1 Tax=Lacticaseibacillus jixiensis TaxID=3231926 RepID=UPI0036F2694F